MKFSDKQWGHNLTSGITRLQGRLAQPTVGRLLGKNKRRIKRLANFIAAQAWHAETRKPDGKTKPKHRAIRVLVRDFERRFGK